VSEEFANFFPEIQKFPLPGKDLELTSDLSGQVVFRASFSPTFKTCEGMMSTKSLKLFCGIVVLSCASGALATDLSNSITGSVGDGKSSIPYRLFEPQGLQPGQKAPLVLFLHGMGDSGTDNVAQTEWMGGLVNNTRSGQYASYVLAPQIDTHSWFQSFGAQPTEAMKLTISALKKVIDIENIDTSRVYVTGNSMGGMGTWDILAREPKLFAAAVPMSGGGDTSTAGTIKDIPVWAFHGDRDTIVPVSATRDMIQALRDAGGDPKYTEVAGGGHVIWDPIYNDESHTLYPWLFSQHLSPSTISVEGNVATEVANTPEPASLTCLAVAGMALLGRRRRGA
jgi:predicted esterase